MATSHHQRGMTLVEVLVGFLVLSLGLLGAARLQTHLRLNADIARQRSEAVRLAQQDIERARAFSDLAGYSAIATGSQRTPGTTEYTLDREILPLDGPRLKSAAVTVRWSDRAGNPQQIRLDSTIAGTLPLYSAALMLPSQDLAVATPLARPRGIPLGASDLGDGRSVWKPASHATTALVFSHATGQVIARCTGIDPSLTTHELTAGDLGTCSAAAARVISGHIRFSLGPVPDARDANDMPLPLSVALASDTDRLHSAECHSEAMKTVTYTIDGRTRTRTLPLDATAAGMGASRWVDRAERFVAYACVTTPGTTGTPVLTPFGWALGTSAADMKVCRYTGGGSAPVHTTSINLLVIRGDLPCPSPGSDDGPERHNAATLPTVQHQP